MDTYVAGMDKENVHDSWAVFKACAAGEMPKAQ
jgi:hypothetical protein